MDTLDEQIQVLLKDAPNDGVTGTAMAAIAPTLKAIAGGLKHTQYYVLQTLDQGWVMTHPQQSPRTQCASQHYLCLPHPG
jgi:hypothetical protein